MKLTSLSLAQISENYTHLLGGRVGWSGGDKALMTERAWGVYAALSPQAARDAAAAKGRQQIA